MRPLPRVFAVTTDAICRAPDFEARVRAVAEAGPAAAIVVRAPGSSAAKLARFAEGQRDRGAEGQREGAAVIIHARPDLARAIGADGVQLRRDDLSPEDARKVMGKGWIGVSIHERQEAEQAVREGADYLVAGCVFESTSHPGRPGMGLEWLTEICGLGRPVIAIGGMTPQRAAAVREAGAFGVAAISAIWDEPDSGAAVRDFLTRLDGETGLRGRGPDGLPALEIGLTVNGEARRVQSPLTLADLMAMLELDPRAVVVELNRRIVRRPELPDTPLRDGDAIELVHFVGGG